MPTYNHPRKAISFRKEGRGRSNPPDKISAHASRCGLHPYPPSYRIYGWMTLTKMWVPICFYCSNWTKFGQLILRKIIKIVATRSQILRLYCTEFDFGCGSAPDPTGGAYSAPPDPLAAFGALLLRGGERGGKGRGEGREGEVGREGDGRGLSLPKVNFLGTTTTYDIRRRTTTTITFHRLF